MESGTIQQWVNRVDNIDDNLTIKDVFTKYPKIRNKKGYHKFKECVTQMFTSFMMQFLKDEDWDNKELIIQKALVLTAKTFVAYSLYDKETSEQDSPDSSVIVTPQVKIVEILASKTKKIAYIDSNLFETLTKTMPPKNYVINKFFCPELLLIFPVKNSQNILVSYFAVANEQIEYFTYSYMGVDGGKQYFDCGHISLGIPVNEEYPINVYSDAYEIESYEKQITGSEHGCFWVSNFLLWQQSMHDKGEEIIELSEPTRQMGFGKNSKQLIVPQVIGEGYKPKVIRNYETTGTHASPRTHWRSGHWRQHMVGSRKEPQHKTIWVEPVLVNS